MKDQQQSDHLSTAEIADAIMELSETDWVRVRKVANRLARPTVSAEELIQEAFTRSLAGTRRCPRAVCVVRFLAEAMRSIAHDEQEKSCTRTEKGLVEMPSLELIEAIGDDSSGTPETSLLEVEGYECMVAALRDLFKGDEIAWNVIEGLDADLSRAEICELLDIDETTYNSKRRTIRRRIEKRFPEGWKS